MITEATNNNTQDKKLYAGKYETVEALEEGYKLNSRAQTKVSELESKLSEVTKIPEEYITPPDITLHENDIADAKRLAKSSGMTQAQYDKFVRETNIKSQSKYESYENAKKEIGADNLNILQDYVAKTYPEKLRDSTLRTLIMDKEAREAALAHRQQLLNNKAPGIDKPPTGNSFTVTHDDMLKARDQMLKHKGDMKARSRYLSIQAQLAQQKKG